MLFIQEQYKYLIAPCMQSQHYLMRQFLNQEYAIEISSSVAAKNCIVIGSLTASPQDALELLLLIATLRSSGSCNITLFSPYLGYQRQDNLIARRLQGLHCADLLLHAVGVDRIVTIDPHNPENLQSLQVPISYYNIEHIFQEEITNFVHAGFGFVFPDYGAAKRYTSLLKKFSTTTQGYFIKKRLNLEIELSSFTGVINSKVMLLDDILDSGTTLVQVCIALRSMGVEEIVIFVTHAFFHGKIWQDLFELGVILLYCTNSLPQAAQISRLQIQVKSIAFLLQKSM